MSKKLWEPSLLQKQNSNMKRFLQFVNGKKQKNFNDYFELYKWSCEKSADFWQAASDFFKIVYHDKAIKILENSHAMPGAKWFVGATLNYAENLLCKQNNDLAIIFTDELDNRTTYTYAQLYKEVAIFAAALKEVGVQVGDRVAAITPNCPAAIIGMLATTSLGAIWSSCSPDFGDNAIVDRFAQIEPKILIATNGYYFKGKEIDCIEKTMLILKNLPKTEKLILFPFLSENNLPPENAKVTTWNALCEPFLKTEKINFVPVNFDSPLYIMFSSGTTGKPKCIVHSVGGTLIQHLKELSLHSDIKQKDHFFFYTTCGWMMWNWTVSALALGCTLVLYDGNPFFPTLQRLWKLIEEEQVTIFGTSARYLAALEKNGVKPGKELNLTSLRTIFSTGSPLLPENFDYVYREIKSDLCLASISGGTDIISCFALGNPLLPVYQGELQCLGLGLSVKVFDEQGKAVYQQKGELVCTQPFPCMPIGFWDDKEGLRYHAAYFEKYPHVWSHGDYAEITEHQGLIVYGRSDAVLNPGGVRIGTSEIYAQVEKINEIEESVVVGQKWHDDERIILFIKLKPHVNFSEELVNTICNMIRLHESPRHVPAKIIPVADIPKTINNKISEIAVKNVIHGIPVKNKEALVNPESLVLFEGLQMLHEE